MIRNHIHQPFIVIGMHRSGTTFLANAMNDAGIFMGVLRDINGEAMHFLSLNQQMLSAEKASWLHPKVPAPEYDFTLDAHTIFAEHMKSNSVNPKKLWLLHNKPWGWKDPRNTFTLKYWLKRFPAAKVIHVVRDGCEVALSLQARNQVVGEVHDAHLDNLTFNFKLWETYVIEGLKWKYKLQENYLEVRYEDLCEKAPETMLAIEKFTGKKVGHYLSPQYLSAKNRTEELIELALQSELYAKLGYPVK